MFALIDKFLAVFVFAPPIYMLFRFVRWWIKQESQPEGALASEDFSKAPENTKETESKQVKDE
jgi:hypothetical protein